MTGSFAPLVLVLASGLLDDLAKHRVAVTGRQRPALPLDIGIDDLGLILLDLAILALGDLQKHISSTQTHITDVMDA